MTVMYELYIPPRFKKGTVIIMSDNGNGNIYKPKSGPIVMAALLMLILVAVIIVITLLLTGRRDENPVTTIPVTTKPSAVTTVRTPDPTGTGSGSATTNVPVTSGNPTTTTRVNPPTPSTGGEITTTTRHYTPVDPVAGSVELPKDDVGKGSLILVDELHSYKMPVAKLITRSAMSKLTAQKLLSDYNFVRVPSSDFYIRKSSNLFLDADAAKEFVNMMNAFAAATGNTDVRLRNAYYYDKGEEVCYNSTGFYIDLEILKDQKIYPLNYETMRSDYYDWFIENACNYGFIHVGEGKSSTGQDIYSSFRYVGIPHATYMHDNDMEFDAYLAMLKEHPIEKVLTFTDHDGVAWQIYYVKAEADKTTIQVTGTAECYRISGNNTDGYIVTVNTAYFK